jgi:hypothetical protein
MVIEGDNKVRNCNIVQQSNEEGDQMALLGRDVVSLSNLIVENSK